jgi:predicted permease
VLRAYCRLLLLAFPRSHRDRVGRPLVQTLVEDSRRGGGRLSPGRLALNSIDVVRAGIAERRSTRRAGHAAGVTGGRPSLATDLRHARRSLARRPLFTATVFITLALGIGLTTAVFSVANGVVLTELPYRDPSRLAFMWTKLAWIGVPRAWVAGPHIPLLEREASTVERIVPIRTSDLQMVGHGDPTIVRSAFSTAPIFDTLGVRALHGRTFVADDEPRNVVILDHGFWRRHFGGDPAAVGRSVDINGDRMEIIGVLPETFRFLVHSSLGGPRAVDVWLPTRWPLAEMSDGSFGFAALVRIKPTATLAQAQAEFDTIGARLDASRYKSRGFGWQLIGVQEDLIKEARPVIWLVLGGAALLLTVVCANVAGLLLVRHADRRREFAVRGALGAGRRDLVRLVVVECLLLSLAAGAAGVAFAVGAVNVLTSTQAIPVPRLAEVTVDLRVLGFAFALSLVVGLMAGVLPAWRFSRTDRGASTLADAARGSSGRSGRARAALVAAELALALVLVSGTALLIRSYLAARGVDPGFDATGTLLADIRILPSRYPEGAQAVAFFERLVEDLRGTPGVTAVGGTSSAPLDANTDQSGVRPAGWTPPSPETTSILVDLIRTTPGYLRAMGIDLVAGRDFSWADREGAQPVALIDESLARQAWPGQDPLGRTFRMDGGETNVTVVGVVGHARQYRMEEDDRPQVLRPYAQDVLADLTLAVRTDGDPSRLGDLVRRTVSAIDPRQPIANMVTVEHTVNEALSGRRLQSIALGTFGGGAALLAALGLYGLLASLVAARQREIGIRMALGADRGSVRRLVARYVLLVAGAGLVAGGLAAAAAGRLLAPFLYGIRPTDPVALGTTVLGLAMMIAVASAVPIRRATNLDPAEALRRD